jgi:hypothetical protein
LRYSLKSISRSVPILGMLLAACGHWCDDCDEPRLFYRYVNVSGLDLLIQPSGRLHGDTLEIPKGDSVEVKESWLQSDEFDGNAYALRFQSRPESCLVFQGKIQNRALDIRVDNYELDSVQSSETRKVYRLAIGMDHLRAASPCFIPEQL